MPENAPHTAVASARSTGVLQKLAAWSGIRIYGALDGLTAGAAAGLCAATVLVALRQVGRPTWLLAILLTAAGIALSGRLGRGLVDGAFLRPWLRKALLAVLAGEFVACMYFVWTLPNSGSNMGNGGLSTASDTSLTAQKRKWDNDRCAEIQQEIDALRGKLASREDVEMPLRRVGQLKSIDVEHNCNQDQKLTELLDAIKEKARTLPAAEQEKAKPLFQAANSSPTSPPISLPNTEKPPRPPAQQTATASPPAPSTGASPADKGGGTTANSTGLQLRPDWLESLLSDLLGAPFGSVSITTETVRGIVFKTQDGQAKSLAEIETLLKGQPMKLMELKVLLRQHAEAQQANGSSESAVAAAIATALDHGDAETVLCHYALNLLDREDLVVAALSRIPMRRTDADAAFDRVGACVYAAAGRNFDIYRPNLNKLEKQHRAMR